MCIVSLTFHLCVLSCRIFHVQKEDRNAVQRIHAYHCCWNLENWFQVKDIGHLRGSFCSLEGNGLIENSKIHADALYTVWPLLHGWTLQQLVNGILKENFGIIACACSVQWLRWIVGSYLLNLRSGGHDCCVQCNDHNDKNPRWHCRKWVLYHTMIEQIF